MMNQIKCVEDIKNTGICGCFFDPKLLYGGILVPINRVFTEDELSPANVAATFNTLIMAPKSQRGFPFIVWNGVTDNQEDPTIFTSGYGSPEPVREGSYNWIFNFRKGGIQLSNNLRSFNGLIGKYAILLVEQTNKLIGTKKRDANGDLGTAGIPLETLYTYPWKLGDGTNPAAYRTQIAFRPEYINEAIAFHSFEIDNVNLLTLNGLITVLLASQDGPGTTVEVSAVTECGEDMSEEYAEELENNSAWRGYLTSTGAAVSPTDVEALDGGFELTFAQSVDSVDLALPSVLAANPINMVGYEGVPVDLVGS